jgi:FdhD protein
MSQISTPEPHVVVPEPAPGTLATGAVAAARIQAVSEQGARGRSDWLAIEEPLEVRAGGPGQSPVSVAVTMRTPGHDFELAVGFLHTEGLINSRDDLAPSAVAWYRRARPSDDPTCNVVRVRLAGPFDGSSLNRNFFATSSCGVCGKATLDQIAVRCPAVADGPTVGRSAIVALPDALRRSQAAFDQTGGLHAAGLFDAEGRLIALREDVGRHNAVDKLVGRALLDGALPLAQRILLVSGRTSFEIVQKAAVAGIPIVCAVSAPSSLAVAVADRLGMTLIGFLRGPSFNVYTRPDRIDLER